MGQKEKIYEQEETVSPAKDALYVGEFYILGALIPLISFFIGTAINSAPIINLIISVILTGIAISITSFIIALNSSESIPKYIVRSLLLSLGAAAVTFIVGKTAALYLHVIV